MKSWKILRLSEKDDLSLKQLFSALSDVSKDCIIKRKLNEILIYYK